MNGLIKGFKRACRALGERIDDAVDCLLPRSRPQPVPVPVRVR